MKQAHEKVTDSTLLTCYGGNLQWTWVVFMRRFRLDAFVQTTQEGNLCKAHANLGRLCLTRAPVKHFVQVKFRPIVTPPHIKKSGQTWSSYKSDFFFTCVAFLRGRLIKNPLADI